MKREDAHYWRERATEARTKADRMSDPYCKRTMLQIAVGYEQLARWADGHHSERGEDSS